MWFTCRCDRKMGSEVVDGKLRIHPDWEAVLAEGLLKLKCPSCGTWTSYPDVHVEELLIATPIELVRSSDDPNLY